MFSMACAVRLWVYRWDFFSNSWNLLDAFVVSAGIIGYLLVDAPLVVLRVIRIARVVRVLKVLRSIRELYMIMHGMTSALKDGAHPVLTR